MSKRFDQDVDTLLSGLKWEQRDVNAVYAALKEDQPHLKRKLSFGLVFGIVLVLLAAVALAIGLSFSPHYTALQTARKAVMEQYGLTTKQLQLYGEDARETDGLLTVVWHGYNSEFLKADAMGDYSAKVDGKGNVAVAWTHDGADASAYQPGDLTAQVWGPKQLQMVLDRYATYQQWLQQTPNLGLLPLKQQAERVKALEEAIAPCRVNLTRTEVPNTGDLPEEEALALAKQALRNVYGITADDMWGVNRRFQTASAKNDYGRAYAFSFEQIESVGVARERSRLIWVKSPSGEIVTDANAPLLQAQAAPSAGLVAQPTQAQSTLTQTQALAVANKILLDHYHITDDMLTLFTAVAALDTQNCQAQWRVAYLPVTLVEDASTVTPTVTDWRWSHELTAKLGSYLVRLNAENGEVIGATWTLDGTQNTETFTKANWADAQLYDAHILPWVLALLRHNSPIIARYPDDQTEWFSVKDAADYDQAFRDAGFNQPYYNHGLPGAGDLTSDQAMLIACEAMQSEYGLTQADIDHAELTCEYLLEHGGEWRVGFYTESGMGTVTLNAASGEVQEVYLDSIASGNG